MNLLSFPNLICVSDIYWLGGSPCCGKSTCAELLHKQFGLHYYKCDDHFGRHLEEGARRKLPVSSTVQGVTHEYIFMRSDEETLRLPFDLYAEQFPLIMEDIASLPRPLLVEGCALLPDLIRSRGVPNESALYMVPEEAFFRAQYKKRTWAYDRLKETSDPSQAFENWMRRDVAFAKAVAEKATAAGFRCLQVDGTMTLARTVHELANHFGISGKPTAS
jgi:hypothetical protein